MKDVHEVARTKEESFRSQIEEIVNLKQMQIVKLQKEASATARILSNRTRVGRDAAPRSAAPVYRKDI